MKSNPGSRQKRFWCMGCKYDWHYVAANVRIHLKQSQLLLQFFNMSLIVHVTPQDVLQVHSLQQETDSWNGN